jgi:hypothetical protein
MQAERKGVKRHAAMMRASESLDQIAIRFYQSVSGRPYHAPGLIHFEMALVNQRLISSVKAGSPRDATRSHQMRPRPVSKTMK